MIPEYIKFKCDSNFSIIKKFYRKTRVDCLGHVIEVVKRSSSAGLNKIQYYKGKKDF